MLAADSTAEKFLTVLSVNVTEAQEYNSTWAWRVRGWTEAIDRLFSSGTMEVLVGPPSGRYLGSNASSASVHIHNRYVDMLAYYGLAGALLLSVWIISMFRTIGASFQRYRADRRNRAIERVFLQALLVSQLIYFIPYFGGIAQGSVMGLIIAAALTGRKRLPVMAVAPPARGQVEYFAVPAQP
jgi:hypothetical protein